jgi:O-antigen/teichoic acid export membrane protein
LTDKTYWGTLLTVAGTVIIIAANYFLIPLFGYEGSSWATLICYFSMTAACYLLGQKFYPIPYSIGKGLAYILATTMIVYGVNRIYIPSQVLATTFHVFVITLYGVAIYFLERGDFRRSQA